MDENARISFDLRALVALLAAAEVVIADETQRCQAAFDADAEDRFGGRAAMARRRRPDEPWRWYQDPDVAVMEAALAMLPSAAAIGRAFDLGNDGGKTK